MERFEALRLRKSTRRYAPQPVSGELIKRIRAEIQSAPRIFNDVELNLDLVESGEREFSGLHEGYLRGWERAKPPIS